jgi:hypothetical protein
MPSTRLRAALAALVLVACAPALAQQPGSTGMSSSYKAATERSARNFAPGFQGRPPGSKLVIVPIDMELFSVGAGGVAEPRADWTEAAQKHFRQALKARKDVVDLHTIELSDADLDELAQINALHGAVAEAVFTHHMMKLPDLPTKDGRLEWTLGEAVDPLRTKTSADYALFFWVRDSYATAERKAAMVAMAVLFGVYMPGGSQVGYASLVDLKTGRIVWFNNLARGFGDLREAEAARETVESLMSSFPQAK